MIEKEAFKVFTLQVTVIPSSYPKYSHCFLEQYYLLNKEFNLNTHKIVNFRVNQGFNIYLYDKDCKILYYSCNSLNAFCADLGYIILGFAASSRRRPEVHIKNI